MSRAEDLTRGFGVISKAVMRDNTISGPARLLYAVLATYANDDGSCYPSNATLVADLGTSTSTLQRLLAELKSSGVIERQERYTDKRQTTSVTVLVDIQMGTRVPTDGGEGVPTGGGDGVPTSGVQNKTTRNKTTRNTSARERATGAPDGYKVTQAVIDWAQERHGVTNVDWLQRVAEEFVIWAESVGKKYVNWDKAIMNAVNREIGKAPGARVPTPGEPTEPEIRAWLDQHPLPEDDPRTIELDRLAMDDDPGYQPYARKVWAERWADAERILRGQS